MLIEDEDEEMPERTLSQVVNELEQVRGKLTSLEAQMQAQRDKARELSGELSAMMSDTLGLTVDIRAKDGLPATVPYRTSRRTAKPATAEGPSTKELRAWAADTNWTVPSGQYQGKSIGEWKNRIPEQVLEQLRAAYSS
jgi:hypothetical protein